MVVFCFILCYLDFIQPIQVLEWLPKISKMNKKVAAGKVKHIILRIPQKLDKSEAEGDIQMEYSCY